MSRDMVNTTYYITSGGKIPVKWTAPEVGIPFKTIFYNHIFKILGTQLQEIFTV